MTDTRTPRPHAAAWPARWRGYVRVDALGAEAEVHRRVLDALASRLPETFPVSGFIKRETGAPAPGDGPKPGHGTSGG